jgi:hypothetical protein
VPDGGAVDWAARGRPVPGETVSGDAAVAVVSGDRTLLSVVDGLGHGPEAAAASEIAAATLRENASEPLEPLLWLCHHALRRTRGVAMTMVAVDHVDGGLHWLGVGNVEGLLVRADRERRPRLEAVFHFPGVVGYRLPQLRVHPNRLAPGDVLVLASDGIATSFIDGIHPTGSVAALADRILAEHARPEDDAMVVVARLSDSSRNAPEIPLAAD